MLAGSSSLYHQKVCNANMTKALDDWEEKETAVRGWGCGWCGRPVVGAVFSPHTGHRGHSSVRQCDVSSPRSVYFCCIVCGGMHVSFIQIAVEVWTRISSLRASSGRFSPPGCWVFVWWSTRVCRSAMDLQKHQSKCHGDSTNSPAVMETAELFDFWACKGFSFLRFSNELMRLNRYPELREALRK